MNWLHPQYLWAELIPLLIAGAWLISERQRQRRLRLFCDPAVAGIITPWKHKILAALLLLIATSAAIALPALPALRQTARAAAVPGIEFMLDRTSLDGRAGSLFESLELAVHALSARLPGFRLSFLMGGLPPRTIVYPTVDARGLEIMVSGLRYEPQQATGPDLGSVLARSAALRAAASQNAPFIVISALSIDEIERAAAAFRSERGALVLVWLPDDAQAPQYGVLSAAGGWAWNPDPANAVALLQTARMDSARRASLTQWLAGLALVLLGGEFALALAARTRMKGFMRG